MEYRSSKIIIMEVAFLPGPERQLLGIMPVFDDKISAPFALLTA